MWVLSISLLGGVLVAIALRDIWVTLFRPTTEGNLSHHVARGVWQVFRATARRPEWLRHAAPAAMPTVITTWALLLTLGWALIFWARMPEAFATDPGASLGENAFGEALYLSMVTLSTLGYGDITPTVGYLRLLAPVETAIGFVLLTASISWVLSIYPALTRQRALAQQISLLREAEAKTGMDPFARAPETAERALAAFCAQVSVVRCDFDQFPVTYYFYDVDERFALPVALPHLLDIAELGQASENAGIRLQATELREAIEDLADTLCMRLLELPTTEAREVLAAYAHDHLRT